ncbi:hypothetical protein OSTOST_22003 [Ostertagia ostertagi]
MIKNVQNTFRSLMRNNGYRRLDIFNSSLWLTARPLWSTMKAADNKRTSSCSTEPTHPVDKTTILWS